ncbi:hypothetical protein HGRIS_003212 [Hohenbuehelia grisea]|uniref:Uncharacterized protein n=1 Tax=Hohenbuehelia grisea TaxID=104357 RepID=A0ABR3JMT2_9AGAR
MLPVHVAHEEKSRSLARGWLGRPLARWLALASTVLFVLWLFGPGLADRYDFRQPLAPPGISEDELSITKPIPRPTAITHPATPPPHDPGSSKIWDERAARVRDAYVFAYDSYKKHASGYDELLPVSLGHKNKSVAISH